jgi:hypothetical protein
MEIHRELWEELTAILFFLAGYVTMKSQKTWGRIRQIKSIWKWAINLSHLYSQLAEASLAKVRESLSQKQTTSKRARVMVQRCSRPWVQSPVCGGWGEGFRIFHTTAYSHIKKYFSQAPVVHVYRPSYSRD